MNVVHTIGQKNARTKQNCISHRVYNFFKKMCNFHFIPDTIWPILFKKIKTIKTKFRKALLYLKMRYGYF